MKNSSLLIVLSLFLNLPLQAQTVFGKWENRNEKGRVNSIVEVYEQDNEVYGRVTRIMREEDRDRVCTKCEGDLRNEPIEGMVIMQGLTKSGDEFAGGTIVDPKSGKEYRCKIWLDEENPDILKVRGYISFFYQTREWSRAE
ncbi:DUF2147 domain-containing protein [Christiangramia sabulilitoris]|uniref:DUF2147 domain-containing protein n=1 Tax=Christiangramia sabulilitoris TaxID=2583991 RepID=A0A550I6M9_9FLAO|nr:DUF2147 domain-containing protein [Christiangramia sabulilitoris]TRO66634.1 DUF2147 domain-containing protein [Christiangramia sabulilitoris]